MKMPNIPDGLWPVMLTPFTDDGSSVDYAALEKLVNWYISQGVNGLFAVCQSSEMFYLSRQERKSVAAFVVKTAAGRVPVVASGHVSDSFEDQLQDIDDIWSTGVEAVVLLPNRFAAEGQPESVMLSNLEKLIGKVDSSIPFGIYECPAPYKRVLNAESTAFCADSGRFFFLKDTCCNIDLVREKLAVAASKNFKIFNANAAQLLDSLNAGCSGYSGVMLNFHPELYKYIVKNYKTNPEKAQKVQNFIGLASCIEGRQYPTCAKMYMRKYILPDMSIACRVPIDGIFAQSFKWELDQFHAMTKDYAALLGI